MRIAKEQRIHLEVDKDGNQFCYMWLDKHQEVLKRTITYRVDFDIDDLDFIKSKRWYIHDWGYAFYPLQVNGVTVKGIYMHRQIAQKLLKDDEILDEVDHINHNKLCNRRSNLRATDRKTNMNNQPPRSIYGRHYIQTIHSDLYHAYAPHEDKESPAVLIGAYRTREEAIQAQKDYKAKRSGIIQGKLF